ncbi:MAG: class I SAM-dependent methyltransferase [Flaviramulus sp.]|nr:class I SAM-dependent methyltransferase [Flaviramulus sp.]NNC49347.1 class I SAM-dependent methyltransferase [Flaviramulus sp.]
MSVKYDDIGINYNSTRRADPYLTSQLLKYLNPKHNGLYLDIGCGTGNYTITLQKRGVGFIGIDPSVKMLDIARSKNPDVEWKLGVSEKTGLPNDYVDGIMASLTIHHWTDFKKAFTELFRILKKDGDLVIFTSSPEQMKGYWLNHYFPKMMNASIIQMPSINKIEMAAKKAGFKFKTSENYFVKPDLEDKFLYCGKHNPELYFNESIRHGISSFSSLANKVEVEKGLIALRKDINSGKITDVIKSYKNDLGDYLFLVLNKKL